jgi:hypothetical protein
MDRVGKKLLATGNGRCNLTNRNLDVTNYHGGNPGVVRSVLRRFDLDRTLAFFRGLGIEPVFEEGGYVYPASGQASSVLDVLRYEMQQEGIDVRCKARVTGIEKKTGELVCTGAGGEAYRADSVILAAGGQSAPNLGSNGSGFKIAGALGHTVREPFPALVQVVLDSPFLKRLSGVRVRAQADARVGGEIERTETGELLFTDYGLSGIPVLQLSRCLSAHLKSGKTLEIHLDLFPGMTRSDLAALVFERISNAPGKTLEMSFVGLLHKRLIGAVLKEAGVPSVQAACGNVAESELGRVVSLLKDWPMSCVGVKSWMFSQVTAGGVSADEVDEETLESRICRGVFFAGEILDVDGDCGGYNLQWAWSSGYLAGESAAAKPLFQR